MNGMNEKVKNNKHKQLKLIKTKTIIYYGHCYGLQKTFSLRSVFCNIFYPSRFNQLVAINLLALDITRNAANMFQHNCVLVQMSF